MVRPISPSVRPFQARVFGARIPDSMSAAFAAISIVAMGPSPPSSSTVKRPMSVRPVSLNPSAIRSSAPTGGNSTR